MARVSRVAAAVLLVLTVSGLTLASARWSSLADSLAASPARIAHGRVWLLVSSGLLAQQPVGASVASFALLAALMLAICRTRVFWLSAALGHIGSTLVVYGLIGTVRVFQPEVFERALASADYGVSAISAAWLGSIAAVAWRARGHSWAGRGAIALSCVFVGFFAYMLRPGISVLTSEHVFAFAAGIAVASPNLLGSRLRAWTDAVGARLRWDTASTSRS